MSRSYEAIYDRVYDLAIWLVPTFGSGPRTAVTLWRPFPDEVLTTWRIMSHEGRPLPWKEHHPSFVPTPTRVLGRWPEDWA